MNKGWHQQLEDLHNSYQNLERTLGDVLVPLLIELAHWLEPILERFGKFAKAHTTLMRVAFVIGLVGTGLLALGGFLAIATSAFGALGATVALVGTAFEGFEGIMAALDVLMDANPIGVFCAAAAALIIIADDVYAHWAAVKNFFEWLGPELAKPFIWLWDKLTNFIHLAELWGKNFITSIIKGLESEMGKLLAWADKMGLAIKHVLPFFGHGGPPGAVQHHIQHAHQVAAKVLRPAPALAAMAAMSMTAGPTLAAAGGVGGGVHFHAHVEPGAAGVEHEELAERMLEAFAANRSRFAQEFAEVNNRARSDWQRTGY